VFVIARLLPAYAFERAREMLTANERHATEIGTVRQSATRSVIETIRLLGSYRRAQRLQ